MWRPILATFVVGILAVSTWLTLFTNYTAIQSDSDELVLKYSVPALVGNSIVTFGIIMYTFFSSSKGTYYKALLLFVLLGGIIGEIYFVASYSGDKTNQDGLYGLTIVNFLIRLFYIFDLTSGDAKIVEEIRQAVSDVAKQPRPPQQQYRPQQAGRR